jgi:hypothetical protein
MSGNAGTAKRGNSPEGKLVLSQNADQLIIGQIGQNWVNLTRSTHSAPLSSDLLIRDSPLRRGEPELSLLVLDRHGKHFPT